MPVANKGPSKKDRTTKRQELFTNRETGEYIGTIKNSRKDEGYKTKEMVI